MIWISSFPRSGNSFLRNILYEVYGISSSTYHKEHYPVDEGYEQYTFVKTHLLPGEVEPSDENIPTVYLVRDGRDALISIAHHRSNIIAPGTDFKQNLKEAIFAAEDSYFGGWSKNVEQWIGRASLIIYFEDLIADPLKQTERLRQIYPRLPQPKIEKLPTFESQKYGTPKYGSGRKLSNGNKVLEKNITEKFYRRGKANIWKEEFPEELLDLFWSYHRSTMHRLGFLYSGSKKVLNPDFDYDIIKLSGKPLPENKRTYKVLIEANKLMMPHNDGIKRYLSELLKAMYPVVENPDSRWQIDLFIDDKIICLRDFRDQLFNPQLNENRKLVVDQPELENNVPDKLKSYFRVKVVCRLKIWIKWVMRFIMLFAPVNFYEKMFVLYWRFRHKLKQRCKEIKYGKDVKKNAVSVLKEFNSYDLIHVPLPQNYKPFIKAKSHLMITVHDITHKLFPQFHVKNNIRLSEKGIQFFIKRKASFLTISENTRKDLIHHYTLKTENIPVVYEAADHKKFKPLINKHYARIVKQKYNIPVDIPYFVTVSTLEPRKNIINTIKAFKILIDENPDLNVNLVICGQNGWKSKDVFNLKNEDRIVFTGFIDENHLPVLYNEALALCYVSYYEGFGLPPLEAISCGTPIIYGNNSSMKEIFNGCGLGANPDDIEQIKNQMKKLVMDTGFHKEQKQKALKRSFDFSWRNTAEKTLRIYESSINKK
jgi:glycosyltransferase involved in cell wall biosynthesis